jgi:translation initiation factor 5B
LSKKEKDALKKQKKKEKEKAAKASGAAKKGTDGGDGKTKKSGMGDLIKEHLKKQQEEEERRRAIEEAEERRLAELAAAREEKARLERERKDREKQKKKDRIARQKADGTYMTAEEKAKRRKAQEQLELMKAQGMVVLGADGTSLASKPKYGKPKKVKEVSELGFLCFDHCLQENVTVTEASKDDDASADDDDDRTSSDGSDVADDWAADADTATKVRSPSDTNGTVVASHEASPPTAAVASVVNHQSSTSSCVIDDNNTSSMRPAVVLDDVDERAPPNETREQQRERIKTRLRLRAEKALALRDLNDLRSPVICVLGHVDTGKTKMLDRVGLVWWCAHRRLTQIRRTHVQDGEAGGITQQIGATEVPASAIIAQTTHVKHFKASTMHLPGFLVIDTPGHESFRNLRSRGSNLCDVAILIVDIMHGLEPQTIESIEMLKQRQCPFVVGLNKIDRLYEWKTNDKKDVRDLIAMQLPNTQLEFNERVAEVKLQFAQKCALNVCLYWENDGTGEYISMVPTSAVTGDGVGNLMAYLAMYAQENLRERIAFNEHLDCTVLEVKSMAGLGTTIDVVLVNGRLHYGDTIVLAGTDGAITTQIRELLMPEPLKEMRVKNPYRHFKEVRGAYGVKVLAKDLDKALAGLPLLVAVKDDEVRAFAPHTLSYCMLRLSYYKRK